MVNPVAGMGGAVALSGTDGPAVAWAYERGARPVSGLRAARAVRRILAGAEDLDMLVAEGAMGADLVHGEGARFRVVSGVPDRPSLTTTAADTAEAARRMVMAGVDLLIFAGGDGTARDVVAVTGDTVPVLGIPAGVKMHSAVFTRTPEGAAEVALRYLRAPESVGTRPAEVLDVDEGDRRAGRSVVRLYAIASVPDAPDSLQGAKPTTSTSSQHEVDALCAWLAGRMESDLLYLFGPGTTTARILTHLGMEASPFGVDAVVDGVLVGRDLTETQLLGLLDGKHQARLVLGVVGGQGFLLGRGNQQISAEVVRRVGEANVVIVADEAKVAALYPAHLHVDLGDAAPLHALDGYRRVLTGRRRVRLMKVVSNQ